MSTRSVFPPLPVRQWVLSVPKCFRYFLEREPRAVRAVLHIFLRVIETHLRKTSPGACAQARLGAISFEHCFGCAPNRHIHYQCCIIDGLFKPLEGGQVRFLHSQALTPRDVAIIAEQVRHRVLRWFARRPPSSSSSRSMSTRLSTICPSPGAMVARRWHSPRWSSGASHLNQALPKRLFARLGLVSLMDQIRRLKCFA